MTTTSHSKTQPRCNAGALKTNIMMLPFFSQPELPEVYTTFDNAPIGKSRATGTRPQAAVNRTAKRRNKNKLARASRRRNR